MRSAIAVYCVACGEKALSECAGDICKCLNCHQTWDIIQLTKLCWKIEERDERIKELEEQLAAEKESTKGQAMLNLAHMAKYDDHLLRIARLEKQLAARQWQPIDSAPKDGTEILA